MDAKTRAEFNKWFKDAEPFARVTDIPQWGIEHERAKWHKRLDKFGLKSLASFTYDPNQQETPQHDDASTSTEP